MGIDCIINKMKFEKMETLVIYIQHSPFVSIRNNYMIVIAVFVLVVKQIGQDEFLQQSCLHSDPIINTQILVLEKSG